MEPQTHDRRARERAALRRVLGGVLVRKPEEIELRIAPGGKPEVDGCEFSLSHSGPWLLIATASEPLGVDVEAHRPRREPTELAERFFSAADLARLRGTDGAGRGALFLRQWVAKEAALKAAGLGLGGYLQKARCLGEMEIEAVAWDAEYYAIHEFTLRDGTPGALAWRGSGGAEIAWREPAELGLA